ncbi:mycofactocin biosynthesis peptidyl-dipeptidase MftE [Streptomyces sp. NBC_01762]|uniref:mycofactocin biosynthesis peptidyl-dipeptidase MftE n=1 Tax=Streptomyces sp. NBC_01762 TaxID=2975933 RepID=UPI002DDC03D3|nr:mycofactocin biosynthesis peptidyl-dipeptidase MftE [Streptomyces sp. NBC_01762]WSC49370.1 mycofactocin biosynthesis peptidyl-dipeptidase MftE [Streptomyces sp. NBC_01762]
MTMRAHADDLARRPWPTVPRRPMVLVPVGSFEQHGPHLPLDTDTRIADAVAHGAARRLKALRPEDSVLVTPPLTFTASGEHQGFPGTISIGHEALRFMLVELVRSLSLWSGRVVFVNGHGGNVGCLRGVVAEMTEEGRDIVWVPCEPPGGDAHAGRTETSLLLHLAPDHVDMAAAVRGNTTPIRELMPALRANGVRGVSPTGVLGDPTGATAQAGAQLLDALVADVARRIEATLPHTERASQ